MLRTTTILGLVLCLGPAAVYAFGGTIQLFPSPAGIQCVMQQNTTTRAWVLHYGYDGTTGVKFSAPIPACAGLVYLTDDFSVAVVSGDTQSGVVLDYGECVQSGTTILGSVFALEVAATEGCCRWDIAPHFSTGAVESIPCSGDPEPAGRGCAAVSKNLALCGCWVCGFVSTERSSWGAIKELFRAQTR